MIWLVVIKTSLAESWRNQRYSKNIFLSLLLPYNFRHVFSSLSQITYLHTQVFQSLLHLLECGNLLIADRWGGGVVHDKIRMGLKSRARYQAISLFISQRLRDFGISDPFSDQVWSLARCDYLGTRYFWSNVPLSIINRDFRRCAPRMIALWRIHAHAF